MGVRNLFSSHLGDRHIAPAGIPCETNRIEVLGNWSDLSGRDTMPWNQPNGRRYTCAVRTCDATMFQMESAGGPSLKVVFQMVIVKPQQISTRTQSCGTKFSEIWRKQCCGKNIRVVRGAVVLGRSREK